MHVAEFLQLSKEAKVVELASCGIGESGGIALSKAVSDTLNHLDSLQQQSWSGVLRTCAQWEYRSAYVLWTMT